MGGSRMRIRKTIDLTEREKVQVVARVPSHYWAWSRPHVAEDLDRLERNHRDADRHGATYPPRFIHTHSLELPCTETCILVEQVGAELPVGPDEIGAEALK